MYVELQEERSGGERIMEIIFGVVVLWCCVIMIMIMIMIMILVACVIVFVIWLCCLCLCYEENDTRRTRSIELKHTSYILVDLHEI